MARWKTNPFEAKAKAKANHSSTGKKPGPGFPLAKIKVPFPGGANGYCVHWVWPGSDQEAMYLAMPGAEKLEN